jgi:hypothetical protein
MRQYSRVKKEKGDAFTYNDLKDVYTIVIYEKSLSLFKDEYLNRTYIHRGEIQFNTGLQLQLLQKYVLIALDVFAENNYSKCSSKQNSYISSDNDNDNNELTGWLSLLITENIEDTYVLIKRYPWLEPIYQDMASYLQKPEEVLYMFSDALKILDKNTELYMIEELQGELTKSQEELIKSQQNLEREKIEKENEHKLRIEAEKEANTFQREIERLRKMLESRE